MTKIAIFSGAGILLLTAIGLMFYSHANTPVRTFTDRLKDRLPPPPPGWTLTENTIADTPEMQKAVGELLNFDDAVFVDYTKGGRRLSVYMAYWTPGKMSQRLVAGHTPDVCWVGNGWTKVSAETVTNFGDAKRLLPPAESRCFQAQGRLEYVWFWHVVGAGVQSYGTGDKPPWYAMIADLLSKGLNQRQEQFFIRLSSETPLAEFDADSPLTAVLDALPLP